MKVLFCIIFTFSSLNLLAQFGSENVIAPDFYNPESASLADLDGDGDIDILVAASSNNRIAWFDNQDGLGNFSPPILLTNTAMGVTSIDVADVDNDGDLDIVAALAVVQELVWYENEDGLGTFGEKLIIAENVEGIDLTATIDLNEDGNVDLVITNILEGTVSWLENQNGVGQFNDAVQMTNGFSGKISFHFADLNGDNYQDVLIGAAETEDIVWLENLNGTGSFNSNLLAQNSTGIEHINTTDLDGDNDLDVLIASVDDEVIRTFKNSNGLGNFVNGTNVDVLSENNSSYFIEAIDVDGDGDQDIMVSLEEVGGNPDGVRWYENLDGLGTAFSESVYVYNEGELVHKFYFTDLDSDANLDIILIDKETHNMAWTEWTGGINDFSWVKYIFESNGGRKIHLADLDNDSDLDVVAERAWLKNLDDSDYFDFAKSIYEPFLNNTSTADIDGDGDLDLIFADREENRLFWKENLDGLGDFGDEKTIVTDHDAVQHVGIADFDNDGDKDIVAGSGYPSTGTPTLVFYENTDGTGNFDEGTLIASSVIYSLEVGDLDADGDIDFVTGASLPNGFIGISAFFNTGFSNSFDRTTIASFVSANAIALEDIDGDADLDVVYAYNTTDQIGLIKNEDGLGDFGPKEIIGGFEGIAQAVKIADLDDDGDSDVVVADYWESKVLFIENIDGYANEFKEEIAIIPYSFGVASLDFTDYDNDGDLDIFTASIRDGKIAWHENLSDNPRLNGTVYWDANNNGNFDANEEGLFQQPISLQPQALHALTSQDGQFNFIIQDGQYDLSCQPLEGWELTTDSLISLLIDDLNNNITQNFGVRPVGEVWEGQVDLSSAPTRCGFTVPFWLNCTNFSNQTTDGTVSLVLDDLTELVSADPMPDEINGNQLMWSFDNILPTYTNTIKLELEIAGVSFLGEMITINSQLNLFDQSENLVHSDVHEFISEINCAYDPNDKLVEPNFPDFENYTLFGDTLTYTIRFQNTGTDTAFNVKLVDYLDANLDWSTFKVLASSHPQETFINDFGKALFRFDNIMLPDSSTNEIESHGFVKYQILPKEDLTENTPIRNQAGIYFDFNPPIITNEVTNLMVSQFPVLLNVEEPCGDEQSGAIESFFVPGDWNYAWSTGQSGSSIVDLNGGDYGLTITDENGDIFLDTVIILETLPAIFASTSSTPEINNNADGTATISPSGGVPPFDIVWQTNPVQTGLIASNLATGTYSVIVIDANGCSIIEEIIVDHITNTAEIESLLRFEIFPNPAKEEFYLSVQTGNAENWSVEIFNYLGQRQQQREGIGNKILTINNLPNGAYFVNLKIGQRTITKKLIVIE